MAITLQNIGGALLGKTGRLIDVTGNYFGNFLPDFKVSENLERIGGILNPPKVSATEGEWTGSYGVYRPSGQVLGSTTTKKTTTNPYPNTNLTNTSGGGGESGGGGGGYSGPSEMDIINSEYDAFNQALNEQENLANQNFTNYQNQITSQQAQDQQKIADQKATKKHRD